MTITEEMIAERAKKNNREYMRSWRQKNREEVNAYQREWRSKFKEETGMSYTKANRLARAERELRAELEG